MTAHIPGIPLESRPLSRTIGFATALLSSFFGLVYLIGLGINLRTSGSVYPSGGDVRIVSAGIALLWNLALVVLFTALRREAKPERAILAELALVFAILVCGASGASWVAGMMHVLRFAGSTDPAVVSLFDPYDPASFPYMLEHLAWGLFFGLAAIFAGLALRPSRFSPWVNGGFILTGLLSLGHFIGVVTGNESLISLGYLSWGVALPVACALVAGVFRQVPSETTLSGPADRSSTDASFQAAR